MSRARRGGHSQFSARDGWRLCGAGGLARVCFVAEVVRAAALCVYNLKLLIDPSPPTFLHTLRGSIRIVRRRLARGKYAWSAPSGLRQTDASGKCLRCLKNTLPDLFLAAIFLEQPRMCKPCNGH